MPRLTFWYDFASTYSYLSAMRIGELAARAGVAVAWRPFLLGPIFKAQGWDTSPFNIYPAKGRYMVRDIERIAVVRGIPFRMPAKFPANGLLAARIASLDLEPRWSESFSRAVFEAEFACGEDIGDARVLAPICTSLSRDFTQLGEMANSDFVKENLRKVTEHAREYGIFGSPTFVAADGELFWGDDRLEQALDWALQL